MNIRFSVDVCLYYSYFSETTRARKQTPRCICTLARTHSCTHTYPYTDGGTRACSLLCYTRQKLECIHTSSQRDGHIHEFARTPHSDRAFSILQCKLHRNQVRCPIMCACPQVVQGSLRSRNHTVQMYLHSIVRTWYTCTHPAHARMPQFVHAAYWSRRHTVPTYASLACTHAGRSCIHVSGVEATRYPRTDS